jgi:hypothetical protein
VRVDIDAGYMLLAQRIAGFSAGAAVTPLGRSLAAVRDPAELSKRCAGAGQRGVVGASEGTQLVSTRREPVAARVLVSVSCADMSHVPPFSLPPCSPCLPPQAAGDVSQAATRHLGALHLHNQQLPACTVTLLCAPSQP